MNNLRLMLVFLTVLILGLNNWQASAIHGNSSSFEESSTSAENHAPIYIDGNEALATFIEDEGLSGEGTSTYPYVIEDFIIDASTAYGIEIRSTDACLIIQNCTVEGGGDAYDGIHLFDARNVNISSNLVVNNSQGIFLRDSNNNTLSGNTASYNTASYISAGIYLVFSSNNTLFGNNAKNNLNGIILARSSDNTLSGNTASYNDDFGIQLVNSNNNVISGNAASDNGRAGICLVSSSNNTLFGNNANDNLDGIVLSRSSDNTLSGNAASYNDDFGIQLATSSNNMISGNIVRNNDGSGLWNGSGIYMYASSNSNTIYFNDIYENTKGQAAETDDCTENHWDNGTIGNYWGDDYLSTYSSATNDGTTWNIPYEISGEGGGIDHYPLVKSITSEDTTEDTTDDTTTTEDTTPATTPSWNVLLLLLSFIVMFPLRRCKKKT